MEKIWLKNYPKGVPAEIDPSTYKSIVQVLDESLSKYADRPAYYCMGGKLTFADVDRGSRQVAAWLQAKGLARGARVAIMMPNILQYPLAVFGILRAGMTVVNVNPLYTPRELEHQLKDSGAKAIFILENFAKTLEQVLGHTDVKHVVVARMGDMLGALKGTIVNLVVKNVKKMVPDFSLPGATAFKDVLSAGRSMQLAPVQIGPDDVAFLQYTGGTTGVSKGATLLHRNIVANGPDTTLVRSSTLTPLSGPGICPPMFLLKPDGHWLGLLSACLRQGALLFHDRLLDVTELILAEEHLITNEESR